MGHGGWTITFESSPQWRNPLMGWAASADPMASVDLTFKSKEDAIFYCESNAHDYVVLGERTDQVDVKSYASNVGIAANILFSCLTLFCIAVFAKGKGSDDGRF